MGKVNNERIGLIRDELDKMRDNLESHMPMTEGIRVSFQTLHQVSELLVDFIQECKNDNC